MTAQALIVDDDQSIREYITAILEQKSPEIKVTQVSCANDAIVQFHLNQHDLCLVDMHMPGMKGLSLCRLIQNANPLVKVILMTSDQSIELSNRANNLGIEILT